MGQYIIRRLIMTVPVLLGVIFLTFAIAKVTPGDPVMMILGSNASGDEVEALRHELGLDAPVVVQFGRYVWNALHGDLGKSIRGQTLVSQEILERLPNTFQLTVAALTLAMVAGVGLGLIAAFTRSRLVEGGAMVSALIGLSIPNFWLAILAIIVFGVQLRWVSTTGGEGLKDLILPSICLALGPAATLARLTRSSVLEVVSEDYVRTARAKGLSERIVAARHVMRNALIPIVTVIGLQFGALMGGAFFIESIFARPGLGRFALNAIQARDYPQVQGVVLFMACTYVFANLGVDLLYGVLDPRIRVA
jgi:ABC-type dipeptide/oligopeptide/nickel transport system permease component